MKLTRRIAVVLVALTVMPPVGAQPLPLYGVGDRDDIVLTNPTANGSPALPVVVWYPSNATGQATPLLAPPPGGWPVIVWLHGKCALGTTYRFYPYALAAQGYVVVLENSAGCDENLQRDDAIALYQALQTENATTGAFLEGAMDLQAVGLGGHSMGAGNVFRVLAQNPGYKAGIAYGAWRGTTPASNWPSTWAPAVQTPTMLIHGHGDQVEPWQTALDYFNNLGTPDGVHVFYSMDMSTTHFNITLPNWPGHGAFVDWEVFATSIAATVGFFDRWVRRDPAGLESVVGLSGQGMPHVDQVMTKIGRPQIWSDVQPALSTVHCLNVLAAPGFAGIYVSGNAVSIPTSIGELILDPASTFPLVQAAPGPDRLLRFCVPMPGDPGLVGLVAHHQGLGIDENGVLELTPGLSLTISN